MGALDYPAFQEGATADYRRQQFEDEAMRREQARGTIDEQRRIQKMRIAAGDIVQQMIGGGDQQQPGANERLRVNFFQAPKEYQHGMIQKYGPENAADIADIHNKIAAQVQTSTGQLSADQSAVAEAISKYQQNPATVLGRMPAGEREKIMAYVQSINPEYQQSEFANRSRMRQEFTSGQSGKAVKALNQVTAHLGELNETFNKLNNTGVNWYNAAKNAISGQFDDPAVAAFQVKKQAVASEIAKLMKGSGVPAESEIKEWEKSFNNAMGPQQMKAVMDSAARLMGGAVSALHNQYETAFSSPRETPFLDENSQKVFRKLGIDPTEVDPMARGGETEGKQFSPEDLRFIKWARTHSNDPRAQRILRAHGLL